jgi:hypothetical protein
VNGRVTRENGELGGALYGRVLEPQ